MQKVEKNKNNKNICLKNKLHHRGELFNFFYKD